MSEYLSIGALSVGTWCSSANPQSGCTASAGVCKPMDSATLAVYKDLQRELNRILSRSGKGLLGIDGRIGPATKKAVEDALQTSFADCDAIAAQADSMVSQVRAKANSLGAPAADLGGSGFPWWMVLAGIGGGILAWQMKKRKKGKAKR